MQALHDVQQKLNDLVTSDSPTNRQGIESRAAYDPRYMKEGYLQKKGQRLKVWKRRWFVCDGHSLCYYINRKDKKPNVVIPLAGATVSDGGISENWGTPRVFLTDGTTGIVYCLTAETSEIIEEWLVVLRNVVAKLAPGGAIYPVISENGNGNHARRQDRKFNNHQLMADMMRSSERHISMRSANYKSTTMSKSPGKVKRLPTNVKLENELATGLEQLEILLGKSTSHSSQQNVQFRPIGTLNGVIQSIGVHPMTGKSFARARLVLPVSSEYAAYIISDNTKRCEWDLHFPVSRHIASFDESTDLIHLSATDEKENSRQLMFFEPYFAPHVAAAIGSLVGCIFSISGGTWESIITNIMYGGLLGLLLNSIDLSSMVAPRDLVLLRHTREAQSSTDENKFSDDDHQQGIGQSPTITILEKSVVNELVSARDGCIRAHISLSGWLFEPIGIDTSLATFVTDIDLRGYISQATMQKFALERLNCVAVLREFLYQNQLSGLDEDQLSIDGDGKPNDRMSRHLFDDTTSTVDIPGPDAEFHPRSYMHSMARVPTGGLKLIDKEVAKKQGGVVKEVIKSAGAKMLEGKSAVSLSLPVRIFEPRTNLERIADLFLYGPTFLTQAADAEDPLERFKYVMTFAIAGLHHGAGQLKPFNPILGETYQGVLNDGAQVCLEHTSHHPPISNFQCISDKYQIAGHVLWQASLSMKSNSLINSTKGPIRISFPDGTLISYTMPSQVIGGVLWGDRTWELSGNIVFTDSKNKLQCELKFNPDKKDGMGGMFSSAKTPSDYIRGAIINTATNQEVCQVEGSWLDDIRFNDKTYWTFDKEQSGYIMPVPKNVLLESDSRFREDRLSLDGGDLDEAQEWKVKLEVLQRADRKIRNEGRRPNHWSFKEGEGH